MAVKYVKDFEFAPSPPRPTIQGYARGGRVTTPQPYAKGGGVSTPQRFKTGGLAPKAAVDNRSGHSGSMVKPKLAKGEGNVKRAPMSEKPEKGMREEVKSAVVKKAMGGRISNLGKYAHGGKVAGKVPVKDSGTVNPSDAVSPGSFKRTPPGEKASNAKAAKSSFAKPGNTAPATPQKGNVERMAGWSDFARGGGVNPKRNAAIHAKAKKEPAKMGAKAGALGAILSAMPPGGAPGMGAPPGGPPPGMPMGPPQGGPPMGSAPPGGPAGPPGQPMMARGGEVKHVVVHHISHKA